MLISSPISNRSRVIPWLVLTILGVLILILPLPFNARSNAERTFHVEASQFAYSPAILEVKPGTKITIELTSQDVVHGLAVDGYNLQIQADPGQTSRLTFTADRSGSFRLRCSVTCGPMHPFMIGKLKVGDNHRFWKGAGLAALIMVAGLWKAYR